MHPPSAPISMICSQNYCHGLGTVCCLKYILSPHFLVLVCHSPCSSVSNYPACSECALCTDLELFVTSDLASLLCSETGLKDGFLLFISYRLVFQACDTLDDMLWQSHSSCMHIFCRWGRLDHLHIGDTCEEMGRGTMELHPSFHLGISKVSHLSQFCILPFYTHKHREPLR